MVGILFDTRRIAENMRIMDFSNTREIYDVHKTEEFNDTVLYAVSDGNPFAAAIVAQKLIDEGTNLIVFIYQRETKQSEIENITEIENFLYPDVKLAHLTDDSIKKKKIQVNFAGNLIGVLAASAIHDVQCLALSVGEDGFDTLSSVLRKRMNSMVEAELDMYGPGDAETQMLARSFVGAFDKAMSHIEMVTEVQTKLKEKPSDN